MNIHFRFISVLTAIVFSSALSASAQEMDVDQADSLRFNDFHTDKKASVKVWDKKPDTTKTYSDNTTQSKSAATPTSSPDTKANTATPQSADGLKGKRFEMRERYTLTRSTNTPYSAFYVIEPLYKQAAQLCPKGWKKLSERSEPIEQDYYLYYEIECL